MTTENSDYTAWSTVEGMGCGFTADEWRPSLGDWLLAGAHQL